MKSSVSLLCIPFLFVLPNELDESLESSVSNEQVGTPIATIITADMIQASGEPESPVSSSNTKESFFNAMHHPNTRTSTTSPRRRRLLPQESVILVLNEEIASGSTNPHFIISADTSNANGLFESASTQYEIEVVLADTSVTFATTYSVNGGPSQQVQEMSSTKFLVSPKVLMDGSHSGNFVLLVVNDDTGEVTGLAKREGEGLVKLQQMPGESLNATEDKFEPPADWTCGTTPEFVQSHSKIQHLDRRLRQEKHEHIHRPNEHDNHHHHDNLRHSHDNLFYDFELFGGDGVKTFAKRRRLYATDSFPQLWTYQVDLYIELETAFVTHHGSISNAIAYVNAIVTAISQLYEKEVDTHCKCLPLCFPLP
jgi:hypothetical protein